MKRMLMLAALAAATMFPAMSANAAEVAVRPAIAHGRAQVQLVDHTNWRYKYHNGRWWYYMPGNYWMVHNGSAWTRYQPGVAIAPRAGVTLGPGGLNTYVNPRVNTYYRGPYRGPYYNYRPYYNNGRPYYYARPGINLRF